MVLRLLQFSGVLDVTDVCVSVTVPPLALSLSMPPPAEGGSRP